MGNLNSYLKKGAKIEISEADFGGSWYMGTFISRSRTEKNKLFVEYKTLMSEKDGRTPLREMVDIVQLRPPAPRETSREFCFGEQVNAYFNDGWWEGMITRVNQGVYTVFLRDTREEFDFRVDELRLHREWVKGVWVPPLENHEVCVRLEEPRKNEQNGRLNRFGKSDVANGSVDPETLDWPVKLVNLPVCLLCLLGVIYICVAVYIFIRFK